MNKQIENTILETIKNEDWHKLKTAKVIYKIETSKWEKILLKSAYVLMLNNENEIFKELYQRYLNHYEFSNSLLKSAIKNKNNDIIDYLIKNHASIYYEQTFHQLPIVNDAVLTQNIWLLKKLDKMGENIHMDSDYPFYLACKENKLEVIDFYLKERTEKLRVDNINGKHAKDCIKETILNGHLNALQKLYNSPLFKIDLDYYYLFSIKAKQFKCAKFLYQAGAVLEGKDNSALEEAIKNHDSKIINFLFKEGYKINVQDNLTKYIDLFNTMPPELAEQIIPHMKQEDIKSLIKKETLRLPNSSILQHYLLENELSDKSPKKQYKL